MMHIKVGDLDVQVHGLTGRRQAALLKFYLTFPIMWGDFVREFDDLKATVATLADTIDKVVAESQGAPTGAEVQALTDQLKAKEAELAALLPPAVAPAEGPAPPAPEAPAG